jgi:glutamate-1-semialdehyde aminotransferase
MLVFDYGEKESLAALRERGAELAAIIVEPVQSRAPELQPKEFLHELRKIADQFNIVLIFDEVVTGFRTCMGGAQEYFGVEADLGTYGKVIGGGWPIGVIAGKARYMDALDGGHWQYGDDSIPEVGVTYFAGTFVRHPPALAAAKAVLTYLNEEGPELQKRLNQRCAQMADQLNANFSMLGVPIQIHRFTSVLKLEFTEEIQHEELLFYLMREKGVHVWHHRPFFLTIAHTDEDIDFIINAFKESVKELQQADLLPNYIRQIENADLVTKADSSKPPVPGARLGKNPEGNPAWFIKDPDRPGKFLQIGG